MQIVSEGDAVTKPPKRWENLPWPVPLNKDDYSRHAAGVDIGPLWFSPENGTVNGTIEKDKPKPGETPKARNTYWEIIPDPYSEGGFRLIKKPPPGSVTTSGETSNVLNTENGKPNSGSPYLLGKGISSGQNPSRPAAGVLGQGMESGSGVFQQRPSADILGSGISSGSAVGSGVSVAAHQWYPSASKLGSSVSSGALVGTGVVPGSSVKTPSRGGISYGGAPSQVSVTYPGRQNGGK